MIVNTHVTEFAGKPVIDYEPAAYHYRLREEFDGEVPIDQMLAALLQEPGAAGVTGLVFGATYQAAGQQIVLDALTAAAGQLPNLTAIFLGDIIAEEAEISWIQQPDLAPLWSAYPRLEQLRVRGSDGLRLSLVSSAHLRSLTLECGGLPAEVVRAAAAAALPALTHLEIWFGVPDYGGDATLNDVTPILAGEHLPQLRSLGLRNCVFTDDLAIALTDAPVLARLETLDLSLGTLTDRGARALLACPALRRLQKLDLHHHYLSANMMLTLQHAGLPVDLSEQEFADDDAGERYPSVME